jgi:hypothetical protein
LEFASTATGLPDGHRQPKGCIYAAALAICNQEVA